MRWLSQKCGETACAGVWLILKATNGFLGHCGVTACGGKHCFGTHFPHRPGKALGCRGCGASGAPWTDRWPDSCESRADSGVGAEERWDPEAGERSAGGERSTDLSTQITQSAYFLTNTGRYLDCILKLVINNNLNNFKTLNTQRRVACLIR